MARMLKGLGVFGVVVNRMPIARQRRERTDILVPDRPRRSLEPLPLGKIVEKELRRPLHSAPSRPSRLSDSRIRGGNLVALGAG